MPWHCLALKDKDRGRDRDSPRSKSCAGRRLVVKALGEKNLFRVAPPLYLAALGLPDLGNMLQDGPWVSVGVCVCLEWVPW